MKLAIVVVYATLPGDDDIVDLHLRYIEQCTRELFTLYAAIVRLPDPVRDRLLERPYVRACGIEPTDLRGSSEHAYYLERLIATAIEDGATHVVTLHADSFPICEGWAETLAARLSDGAAFAAVIRDEVHDPKPMTACLLFSSTFHRRYQPRLLLREQDMSTSEGQAYARQLAAPNESGTGYGYLAFKEGLNWFPLRRTNVGEDHDYFGSIHGDCIFHLGAAGHEQRSYPGAAQRRLANRIRVKVAAGLPRRMKQLVKAAVPQRTLNPQAPADQRAYAQVKAALMADPDAYIHYLRTGRRGDDQ